MDSEHGCLITLTCSRALVGRVIGKHGTTVKGVQLFTRAVVDVDQMAEPIPIIRIIGTKKAVETANNIIVDIIAGKFKGFAMLREIVSRVGAKTEECERVVLKEDIATVFVYAKGLGIFPRRQVGVVLGVG